MIALNVAKLMLLFLFLRWWWHPKAWWGYLVDAVAVSECWASFVLQWVFFSPFPLLQYLLFLSLPSHSHKHARTHTQIHGVLHDGWLHALYLQNQGWKVQRFIRGVCLSADKFVWILLSAGQVTRKMVTHLVIKYPREKKLHDEQNSFNTLL